MDYTLETLFGKGFSSENTRAVKAMNEEIRKVGGLLHFNIQADTDGWHAECVEIDGLMTGGRSSHPTENEIRVNIREAIHTAFHITSERNEKPIQNANEFQAIYNFTPAVFA